MSNRIYLDNAATSWPKPESVYLAMDRYARENGAPYGRGTSREATEVARIIQQARVNIGKLIDCQEAQRIVFSSSGTDSLNMALHGLLKPGDHIITSLAEHNSVLRPLRALETNGVEVSRVRVDGFGFVSPDEMLAAIRHNTKMIALIHASNVTGVIQPVEEVSRIAREHDLLFLLDAAQSLGHLPISINVIQCDLLAAPGHKGLLGPTGTGILYVGPRAEPSLTSVRQGGTGTQSEQDVQPDTLPQKFESGNHNVPGIVGLAAGVQFLQETTVEDCHERESQLSAELFAGLADLDHVELYSPVENRLGVLSIQIDGFDPHEAAAVLEATAAIQCRAGFHCAPKIHEAIATSDSGGTVRFSLGAFNSMDQIHIILNTLKDFA